MPKKKLINPPSPRAKKAPFAQGVQVGDTIYVSVQIPQDADGKIVGAGNLAAQTRQTFANIEAVLKAAGATMRDVVKITCYISDRSHYAEYDKVRREVFPDAGIASNTVICSSFVLPEVMIEIESIAVKGCGG